MTRTSRRARRVLTQRLHDGEAREHERGGFGVRQDGGWEVASCDDGTATRSAKEPRIGGTAPKTSSPRGEPAPGVCAARDRRRLGRTRDATVHQPSRGAPPRLREFVSDDDSDRRGSPARRVARTRTSPRPSLGALLGHDPDALLGLSVVHGGADRPRPLLRGGHRSRQLRGPAVVVVTALQRAAASSASGRRPRSGWIRPRR